MPLPDPPAELKVTHGTLLVLGGETQPAGACTVAIPIPPTAGNAWVACASEKLQLLPACITVNVCPATLIVPVRLLVDELGATVKLTVPGPMPIPGPLTVSQNEFGSGAAVQAHVGFKTPTLMVPLPAPEATEAFNGLTPNRQPLSWLMTNDWPAIDSVALLATPSAFAAPTLKFTLPLPVPFAPLVIVTQGTGLDADHCGQPGGELTRTEPLEAASPTEAEPADRVLLHSPPKELRFPTNGWDVD